MSSKHLDHPAAGAGQARHHGPNRHIGNRSNLPVVQALHIPLESFCFTAHLLPIDRGILSTIYVKLTRVVTLEEVHEFL